MAPVIVKFEDKYTNPTAQKPTSTEKKLRKSGKPISLAELKLKKQEAIEQQLKSANTGPSSAKDMKDDIELQRLLSESHLLKNLADSRRISKGESGAELTLKTLNEPLIGKSRVRTLDSRIDQLARINGDERKLEKLEKMPMNMRKGMIEAQKRRIEKYEKEARENGIVLAKNRKGAFRQLENDRSFIAKDKIIGKGNIQKNRMRDRGLKIQSVGRSTRNGLVLSSSDISKIQGRQGNDRRKRR